MSTEVIDIDPSLTVETLDGLPYGVIDAQRLSEDLIHRITLWIVSHTGPVTEDNLMTMVVTLTGPIGRVLLDSLEPEDLAGVVPEVTP